MKYFKGSRWYKCDLPMHAAASDCFQDKTNTLKQWINRAIEQDIVVSPKIKTVYN